MANSHNTPGILPTTMSIVEVEAQVAPATNGAQRDPSMPEEANHDVPPACHSPLGFPEDFYARGLYAWGP
eukprot:m51a1_g13362 hypothetical protein (70) ;mRNA; r:423-836